MVRREVREKCGEKRGRGEEIRGKYQYRKKEKRTTEES